MASSWIFIYSSERMKGKEKSRMSQRSPLVVSAQLQRRDLVFVQAESTNPLKTLQLRTAVWLTRRRLCFPDMLFSRKEWFICATVASNQSGRIPLSSHQRLCFLFSAPFHCFNIDEREERESPALCFLLSHYHTRVWTDRLAFDSLQRQKAGLL